MYFYVQLIFSTIFCTLSVHALTVSTTAELLQALKTTEYIEVVEHLAFTGLDSITIPSNAQNIAIWVRTTLCIHHVSTNFQSAYVLIGNVILHDVRKLDALVSRLDSSSEIPT